MKESRAPGECREWRRRRAMSACCGQHPRGRARAGPSTLPFRCCQGLDARRPPVQHDCRATPTPRADEELEQQLGARP